MLPGKWSLLSFINLAIQLDPPSGSYVFAYAQSINAI